MKGSIILFRKVNEENNYKVVLVIMDINDTGCLKKFNTTYNCDFFIFNLLYLTFYILI